MLANEQNDAKREKRKEIHARKVKGIRDRHIAAGRTYVHVHLPAELVEAADKLKEQRHLIGRSHVIEEALREYLTKQDRA